MILSCKACWRADGSRNTVHFCFSSPLFFYSSVDVSEGAVTYTCICIVYIANNHCACICKYIYIHTVYLFPFRPMHTYPNLYFYITNHCFVCLQKCTPGPPRCQRDKSADSCAQRSTHLKCWSRCPVSWEANIWKMAPFSIGIHPEKLYMDTWENALEKVWGVSN